jgi:hypothetical protein
VLDLFALPTNQELTEIFLYVQTCHTIQKVLTLCILPDFVVVTQTHPNYNDYVSLLHRHEDHMYHFFLADRHDEERSLPDAEQYMNV